MGKKSLSKIVDVVGDYDLTITGRHIVLTEGIKNHTIDKLKKLERLDLKIISITVTIEVQKKILHHVVMTLHSKDFTVKAEEQSDDVYCSIDFAVKKLQKQLKRFKEKIKDHQPKEATNLQVKVFRSFYEEDDYEEEAVSWDTESTYMPPEIVCEEVLAAKTLTYEEAIMKMELSRDAFMVFRSEEDQKMKVIYRCEDEDGHYGIVEPTI